MKKTYILLISMICILSFSINCFANELPNNNYFISKSMVLLGTGYTEDGVFFEVYGDNFSGNVNTRVSVTVERTVVFTGDIFPPLAMSWRETMSDLEMTGTLYLDSFYYNASTNKTTAIYTGTLSG